MIIWLASYPKSGNTWVRLFLDYLLSPSNEFNINNVQVKQFPLREHFRDLTQKVDDINEFAKNCNSAQQKLNLDNKIKILKTHNALWTWRGNKYSFTNEENTLGVIHIVRDPRNVITSILHYFHKENYNSALKFIRNDKVIGGDKDENGLPTIIASWPNHYKSWKKFKKNNLLIRYEDLLIDPKNEFFKITNFLSLIGNFKFDHDKICEGIKHCDFKNLYNQEELYGYKGNSKENKLLNKRFFNLGPKNDWKNLINDQIKEGIESDFKKEMMELGYL